MTLPCTQGIVVPLVAVPAWAAVGSPSDHIVVGRMAAGTAAGHIVVGTVVDHTAVGTVVDHIVVPDHIAAAAAHMVPVVNKLCTRAVRFVLLGDCHIRRSSSCWEHSDVHSWYRS